MPKFTGTRLTEIAVERIGAAPKGQRIERSDALAPGLVLRVDSHARKAWWCRYRVGTKQTKVLLGDWPELGVEAARERAREVRREAERGVDPTAARDARDAEDARAAETFTHLADAFFDVFAPRGKNTKAEMISTVRTHLKPLAGVHKDKLHRSMLADITRGLASPNREGGAKPGAARKAYEAATRIVRWAVSEAKLEHDPFHLMKPPAKGAPRERTLEDRELALLWKAWEAEGAPFGPMQKLLLLTATRRNEVARMEWRELDDADAPTLWTIPAERAKNGKPHAVPLSTQARAVLAALPRGAGPFVFSTQDGARPVRATRS
jgi:integrase